MTGLQAETQRERPTPSIACFVDCYKGERLHVALGNVTPNDRYEERQRETITRRQQIKRSTLERKKKEDLRNAA